MNKRSLLLILAALVVVVITIFIIRQGRPVDPANVAGGQLSDNPPMRAIQNWQQAQSYNATVALVLHLPEMNGQVRRPFTEVSMGFLGDVKTADNGSPEATGRIHGEAKGAGTSLATDGQIRILADSTFFSLNTVPVVVDPTSSLANKWALVDTKLLRTTNNEAILTALQPIIEGLNKEGKETQDDVSATKYQGTVTPEQAKALQEALASTNSGNQVLNIVSRLLEAYNVKSVAIWIDNDSQVRHLEVAFIDRANADTPRAELAVFLKDFGKEVTIDRPEAVETIPPTVFSQLFGSGQVPTTTPKATPRPRR